MLQKEEHCKKAKCQKGVSLVPCVVWVCCPKTSTSAKETVMQMTTFGTSPIDPKEAEKALASKRPNFIRAFFGLENAHMILIKGDNLISKKLVNLAGEECRRMAGTVHALVFRNDGYPKNLYGVSDMDTGTIAINLEHIWAVCCEQAQEKDCYVSIRALWTAHILHTVGHELDHLSYSGLERVEYEQIPQPEREDRANKHATELLYDIAASFDIEPGQLHLDPTLYIKMTQLFQTRGNEPWVIRQRKLLEDALIYDDPNNKHVRCTTLHDWFQMKSGRAGGPEWRQPTFPVSIVFYEDHPGQMAVFSPQSAPEAPAAVVAPVALAPTPVIAVQQPAAVDMSPRIGEEGTAVMVEEGEVQSDVFYPDDEGDPNAVPVMACGMTAAATAPIAPPAYVPVAGPDTVPVMNAQIAQTAAYQGAAAGPYKKKEQKMFAPNNYSDEQIQAFMGAVYKRLHANIFNKCGRQPNGTFTNAAAILEGVRVDDLETSMGVKGIVAEYDTFDANGRWSPGEKCNGFIRGQIFSKSKLPGYVLYLNLRGFGAKRVLSPQNPNTASTTAAKARVGVAITFVINGDKEDADKSKWVGRFENNDWITK
jgi:hypothetical protein